METDALLQALLGGTRRRIVQLLRSEERTVRELADALDLTRNAIRAQLSNLKGEGIVEITGRRPTKRKPEHVYGLTAGAEALFPKSYDALVNAILAALGEAESIDFEAVVQKAARHLAAENKPYKLESSPGERVERARQVLEEMGGLPEITRNGDSYRIEGTRCPITAVVQAHGLRGCDLARALIEELTELPVERRCEVGGECPQCTFVVEAG
ncbi:MAG: helix-turn-helix transcriptional regulator [Salinibacter sp.]|uniref:helix-turn-helix transcriptional regulator n=1 Tax=Salinibacter sp. TaxID=2065818 RepID=UPI0035D44C74